MFFNIAAFTGCFTVTFPSLNPTEIPFVSLDMSWCMDNTAVSPALPRMIDDKSLQWMWSGGLWCWGSVVWWLQHLWWGWLTRASINTLGPRQHGCCCFFHFEFHFHVWKSLYFVPNFTEICSHKSNQQYNHCWFSYWLRTEQVRGLYLNLPMMA